MGLKAELFGGDEQLEACLASDRAYVGDGAVGEHVAKVQTALRKLDSLAINRGEISEKRFGPSTAGAVLSFKTDRHMTDPSCPTERDTIVDRQTMAVLDDEMFALENEGKPRVT